MCHMDEYLFGKSNKIKQILFQTVCHPLWDGASCVPPTKAGTTAVFPCMTMYNHKYYNTKCKYANKNIVVK